MEKRITKVNLKGKEVKTMKKIVILFFILSVSFVLFAPNSETQAAPMFDTSGVLNELFFQNVEVIYRPATACTDATCYPSTAGNDPTGYRRIIPLGALGASLLAHRFKPGISSVEFSMCKTLTLLMALSGLKLSTPLHHATS